MARPLSPMNRIQPCDACGCPMLFHVPRGPPGGPTRMVCEECTRKSGREVACGIDPDSVEPQRR